MRNLNSLAVGAMAVMGLGISSTYADTKSDFTAHHLVDKKPYENYVENLPGKEKLEIREYLDYEQREPCQFYQPIPQGFMRRGCDIVPAQPARNMQAVTVSKTVTSRTVKREVLADYEVHFAFDRAELEAQALDTLDRVAREIRKYEPGEVTVAGHADRAGTAEYNMNLSKRRAQAVSEALSDRGVTNRIIEQEAHGEYDPEVPTPDGIRNAANRRVEIQFLK